MGVSVTDPEKVAEWLHHYHILQTDESRLALFADLKRKSREGDKVATEALGKVIALWVKS